MTNIKVSEYRAWLISRKYAANTVKVYTRPIQLAADKSLKFSDIESLDCEVVYRLLCGQSAPTRHTARKFMQAIYTYRDFLDKEASAE